MGVVEVKSVTALSPSPTAPTPPSAVSATIPTTNAMAPLTHSAISFTSHPDPPLLVVLPRASKCMGATSVAPMDRSMVVRK